MKVRFYIIIFFGLLSIAALPRLVQAEYGQSCANFTAANPGLIPSPPNDARCTLWAQAIDPEGDRVYYIFDFGQGSTNPSDPVELRRFVRVPQSNGTIPARTGCTLNPGDWTPGQTSVPSGTECWADHNYSEVGNPHTAFVVSYDEANHESEASASVPVFITAQTLAASLVGTPATSGWYNETVFNYTTNCTAQAGFTLNYCRTEVSIDNGPWTIVPGGDPDTTGQVIFNYSGTYTFTIDGAAYRFRSTADDTGSTDAVFSNPVPSSGQIQIDQSPPVALASSPTTNQSSPFVVTVSLLDYPNPVTGPNSGVSAWDLQYSLNNGVSWTDCLLNINPGQTSVNFGSGCSPAVTLTPNTTYCFQARARDSTTPSVNQGNYYFDQGTMCTPYQVSTAPIAPHTPTPAINSLVSASNINLRWYGGDADSAESLTYSVYISQPNQGVNIPADLDGQLFNQLPCSSQLPQGCQVSYGPPRNRTPQPGEVYTWRVRVTDGFNVVDSTPIPWSFQINTRPTVSNVSITPSVVNASGTISWRVTDPNDNQNLTFDLYYGPQPNTINGAVRIAGGLDTSGCSGSANSTGRDCNYVWDTTCIPPATDQYITVVAYDTLDYSLPVSSSTFAINHTETRYYPGPGDTNYDTAADGEIKTGINIGYGSIEPGSSFIKLVSSCSAISADANAPGNPAVCGGAGPSCAANPDVPLEDLIPGVDNTIEFSLTGCASTQYRLRYNLVAACGQPYLSVEEGSIYSQGNIKAQHVPPAGYFNATYLILGGGTTAQPRVIQNFISATPPQGAVPVNPNFGPLVYPGINSSGGLMVGLFDYYGLTHNLQRLEVVDGGYNSYGHRVEIFSGGIKLSQLFDNGVQPLGGKVYWVQGNLLVDQPLEFVNGIGQESGAGLIIVEGDLTIEADLSYEPTAPGLNPRQLASVGWLVNGRVVINSSVSRLVGAFYVSGSGGDGSFSTGSGPQQLTIYGAVIARQLQLQRSASPGGQPSEKIVADGRILLNTPPGFMDILKTLPAWQFRTP